MSRAALAVVFILIGASLVSFLAFNRGKGGVNDGGELQALWEQGDYERTYALSRDALGVNPMDHFLLVLHGFSSFQLAVAQITNYDTQSYVDDCIWSLRKALLTREGEGDGRIYYVLGKAYYYKGSGYADLAVSYLERARSLSYRAVDIPEYLGLSYASLQDYRNSVAAFTLALNPGGEGKDFASDILLLAIARSYMELDDTGSARAYLTQCVDISRDFNTKVSARLLLGNVLRKTGDAAGAEAQYLAIIEGGGENAEAHYQLGELYAQRGEPIRARAAWRRAVQIDPAHGGARARLNM